MHDCPYCGNACDCDGEDIWRDNYSQCSCECEEQEEWYNTDDEEFGCCMEDCIMPGLHFPSDCHNSAMLEEQWAEDMLQEARYYPIVKAYRSIKNWLYWQYSKFVERFADDDSEFPF